LVCLIVLALPLAVARADTPLGQLPRSLAAEALAEPQPGAFAPTDFDVADFTVDRDGGSDGSVEAELEVGSLRWVRVARYVVVPRAVVVVRAAGASGGLVSYAGASLPMAADAAAAYVAVPVALIDGASYPILVQVWRDGERRAASFHVRFAPRSQHAGQVLFDSSCSPYALAVRRGAIPADSWLYIGCSLVSTAREDHDSPSLDLYMLWDQAGTDVTFEAMPASPAVDTLWVHRVTDSPSATTLAARGETAEVSYRLPHELRAGFFGAGLGPYYYALEDNRGKLATVAPLLTLYAAYSFNPAARVVYFNAAVLDRHGFIDQGVYLWLEQFRAIDDRLSINLLLGANVLVYSRHDRAVGRLSAPQGVELSVRDFLAPNRNLSAGAFLYPPIAERSYYNIWLRWGSPQIFGEINYIAWEEPYAIGASSSQSVGVSVGLSLLRFLRRL
jgi:hypothetical protein